MGVAVGVADGMTQEGYMSKSSTSAFGCSTPHALDEICFRIECASPRDPASFKRCKRLFDAWSAHGETSSTKLTTPGEYFAVNFHLNGMTQDVLDNFRVLRVFAPYVVRKIPPSNRKLLARYLRFGKLVQEVNALMSR